MRGLTLIKQSYKSNNPFNDHDYCEFCMAKFGKENDELKQRDRTIEKIVGKNTAGKIGMTHNKSWITRQIKLGARIFDIGPAGTKISSPYYAMERSIVDGYFNHFKLF